MKPIGFSTGALAKGNFRAGIELQHANPALRAIELSALRDHELPLLAAAAPELDLSHFTYASVHAPSKLSHLSELEAFDCISSLPEEWPIVAHPELLQTPNLWRQLGARLCLENMDNRKAGGRTVAEMDYLFELFPDASFCLDLGHARQIDPTMATAMRMARKFAARLKQLHVSEVGLGGEHLPLRALGIYAFQLVAPLIPVDCPVIIESVVAHECMDHENRKHAQLFGPALGKVQSLEIALRLTT